MNERRLAALRRALTAPPGEHVDDETLSVIVTAEISGDDVEQMHHAALSHIEGCPDCAAAYEQLWQMMSAALSAMSAAAAAVPPEQVYAALLAQELARSGMESTQARELARQVAVGLPPLLDNVPHGDAIGDALLQEALAQSSQQSSAPVLPALVHAVRQTLSALALFVQGKAAAAWGSQVSVQSAALAGWHRLQLMLLPPRPQAVLGGEEEAVWLLFRQRLGQPLPVNVQARAERSGPLSCRLIVQVDRPGQPDASQRRVRLVLGARTLTAQTDALGEARFESVPIAALSTLAIDVEED